MVLPEEVLISAKVPGAFSATSPWVSGAPESSALSIPGWVSSSCWSIWPYEVALERRVGDEIRRHERQECRRAGGEEQPQPE